MGMAARLSKLPLKLTCRGRCAVLAYTVAACAPNMDVANAALPAFVVTQLFFCGFLIRQNSMPVYWWGPKAAPAVLQLVLLLP